MKPSYSLPKIPKTGNLGYQNVKVKNWMRLDNCPVCRLIKRSIFKGKLFTARELDEAFAEAEVDET